MGLDEACGWIDAHLVRWVVPITLAAIKSAGDLAHAADVLERHGRAEIGARWFDVAWKEIDRGDAIKRMIATDARYAPSAVTYLPFHLSGRTNDGVRDALAAQIGRSEMPPLGWTMTVPALAMFGIEATPAMHEAARAMSVLAHRTEPALLPQDAVYVLAHEIMYATSWGRHAPAWDDATGAYVARALPALVEKFTALGDADIVAELIVATHAVLPACVPRAAWELLARAQTAAGNVEPPATLVTMFPRLPHPALTRTAHTTLVAIMAWASCHH